MSMKAMGLSGLKIPSECGMWLQVCQRQLSLRVSEGMERSTSETQETRDHEMVAKGEVGCRRSHHVCSQETEVKTTRGLDLSGNFSLCVLLAALSICYLLINWQAEC